MRINALAHNYFTAFINIWIYLFSKVRKFKKDLKEKKLIKGNKIPYQKLHNVLCQC